MQIFTHLWTKGSSIGISSTMPAMLQRQLIILNQMSLILVCLGFIFIIADIWLINNLVRFLLILTAIFMFATPLILNSIQRTQASRLFACLGFPLIELAILLSSKCLFSFEAIFYSAPRFILLSFVTFPFILLDYQREQVWFYLSIGLNAGLILLFDFFHQLSGVGFYQMGNTMAYYYLLTLNPGICMVVIMLGFLFFKNIHLMYEQKLHESNLKLQDKNEEILVQNEKLSHQKDEIYALNNHLEAIVLEKTQKLQTRNQQLNEYAFLNAHKLRAPVATILGLYQILDATQGLDEQSIILQKLKETVEELDRIVHQMQLLLDEEIDFV
jgi:signal transduction histidine kinase